MSIQLTYDKLSLLSATIQPYIQHEKVTLKFIQALNGMLSFACQVVASWRAFCRRLIDATMGIQTQHQKIRVPTEVKHILHIWQ